MSREYTREEVRNMFLNRLRKMCVYWDNQQQSSIDKLTGLAFSILVTLDGGSGDLPAFLVIPYPHPDDREYNTSQGLNYFKEPPDELTEYDLGDALHELFFNDKWFKEEIEAKGK